MVICLTIYVLHSRDLIVSKLEAMFCYLMVCFFTFPKNV